MMTVANASSFFQSRYVADGSIIHDRFQWSFNSKLVFLT